MRLLSNLVLFASVAALGFAGGALALALMPPPDPQLPPPERAAAPPVPPVEGFRIDAAWPALFGVEVIPEPEPEPEPEAIPEPEPVVEAEPEENTLYYLTGLVARGSDSWAMVASNDRTQVVGVGDVLEGGEVVRAIDEAGVWIDWGDIRQVIPVQRADLTSLVRIEKDVVPVEDAIAGGVEVVAQLRWPVEVLDARYIEEALFEAGQLAGSIQADGTSGLDVVSVASGQLYDQIGLRKGDTILRINGKSVDSQGLPADTPTDVLNSGSLDLEILRDGTRQVIRVNLVQI